MTEQSSQRVSYVLSQIPRLRAYLRVRTGTCHDAEAVLVELLATYQHKGPDPAADGVGHWLFDRARRLADRQAKRGHRRAKPETDYLPLAGLDRPTPEQRDAAEQARRIQRCLDAMAADQREAVYLKAVEGMSLAEIAQLADAERSDAAERYEQGLVHLAGDFAEEPAPPEAYDAALPLWTEERTDDLDDLRRRVEADPAARGAAAQVRAAVASLRLWRAGFDHLPAPTLPAGLSPRRRWLRLAGLVLLAVGAAMALWLAIHPPRHDRPGPPPARDGALVVLDPNELTWTLADDDANGPPSGEPLPHGMAPLPDAPPLALPGDWRFRRLENLPPDRAVLTYRRGEQATLRIYLAWSSGPSAPAQRVTLDGRRVWAIRRDGVLVAARTDTGELALPEFVSLSEPFWPADR